MSDNIYKACFFINYNTSPEKPDTLPILIESPGKQGKKPKKRAEPLANGTVRNPMRKADGPDPFCKGRLRRTFINISSHTPVSQIISARFWSLGRFATRRPLRSVVTP
jgi:hypothetical protein